jgi:short-chain Z-isoprenyl diphosphate synthase
MHEYRDVTSKLISSDFAQRKAEGDARVPPLHRWLPWRWWVASPIYRIYERHLLRHVQALPVPRHIGLILDGNRRYGRHNRLTDHHQIYMVGAHKLDELLDWCTELHPSVTIWVFSTENLRRSLEEVAGILSAVERKLELLVSDKQIHDRRIRVKVVGRLQLLPASTVASLRAAEAATRHHDGMRLTIAAAYGGREEIVDAVRLLLREQLSQGKSLKEAIEFVTPDAIGQSLYAPDLPDPDLIIRTSGEIRLSGFLLWQSAFSEFYFTDVFWPAFRRIDFLRAVRAFQQRQRRLGSGFLG